MLPSTRALVRVAIVPLSIIAAAGCQPAVQSRLLGAAGVVAQVTYHPVMPGDTAMPGVGQGHRTPVVPASATATIRSQAGRSQTGEPGITELPVTDPPIVDAATSEELIVAERQDAVVDSRRAAGPSNFTPFVAFDAGPASAIVTGAMGTLNWLAAGDRTAYATGLAALSRSVGDATGLAAEALLSAWSTAGERRMEALLAALTQVGVDYRYASSTPGRAFDCSGLVSWSWSIAGADLPHQSSAIINQLPHGDISTVLPADVLWYPGHVSLALGVGDAFVDAPNAGNTIRIEGGHSASAASRIIVGVTG